MKSFVLIGVALVFLSAGAAAETPAVRHACMGDAFRVCWSAMPDRDRVVACMAENKNQLGAACRAVIARYDARRRAQNSHPSVSVEAESARAQSD